MNPFYCAYYSSVFDRNRGRKGLKITQQGLTKYQQHVYRFVEGGKEGGSYYYTNTKISSNCSFLLFNDYKIYACLHITHFASFDKQISNRGIEGKGKEKKKKKK